MCLAPFGDRLKDGYKYEKSKSKKVKRTIPAWASVTASKKVPVTNFAGTQHRVDSIIIEAIQVCADSQHSSHLFLFCCFKKQAVRFLVYFSSQDCNDRTGVSYKSVLKYIVKKYPGMEISKKKFLIRKAMKKHLEKGNIRQVIISNISYMGNTRLVKYMCLVSVEHDINCN